MNYLKNLEYAIALIILPVATFAQDSKVAEINKMEQAEADAIQRLDTIAIEKIWAKNFVINTPRNQTINRVAAMTAFKKGLIHYTGIRRDTEEITITNNIGIAMGQETIKPKEGRHSGKTVKRRYTNVWMQDGRTWTLIARQATDISVE